ncbi:DUF3969 family protein [Paenibacillus shunpengii]|uniref:DUF3969 family protein n=1 Tax=Paenibacillus shunpengii TaxID=2054424 RepID=A0ABW5SNK0_9BACL
MLNLGMLDSLLEGAITFEDAYAYLYRPYVTQLLEQNNANKETIDLFEECCMLEDIRDIAPEKLQNALELKKKETFELLKSTPSLGVIYRVKVPNGGWKTPTVSKEYKEMVSNAKSLPGCMVCESKMPAVLTA